MILTDERGRPFGRPQREDFANDADFVRAVHEHNDTITKTANDAFADAFRNERRKGRR